MDTNEIEKSVKTYDARVVAALRLICHDSRQHKLANPFKDVATGNCYASNGRMAIRFRGAGPVPIENQMSAEDVCYHVRHLDRAFGREYERCYISIPHVTDAAEVALSTVHHHFGRYDVEVIDGKAEVWSNSVYAVVKIPGVGMFRADFILAAWRSVCLLRDGLDIVVGFAPVETRTDASCLRIDSADGRVSIIINGLTNGIPENNTVIINSDTLAIEREVRHG